VRMCHQACLSLEDRRAPAGWGRPHRVRPLTGGVRLVQTGEDRKTLTLN
jgi:hypothetical protein